MTEGLLDAIRASNIANPNGTRIVFVTWKDKIDIILQVARRVDGDCTYGPYEDLLLLSDDVCKSDFSTAANNCMSHFVRPIRASITK